MIAATEPRHTAPALVPADVIAEWADVPTSEIRTFLADIERQAQHAASDEARRHHRSDIILYRGLLAARAR